MVLGFRVKALGLRVKDLGFRDLGLGYSQKGYIKTIVLNMRLCELPC